MIIVNVIVVMKKEKILQLQRLGVVVNYYCLFGLQGYSINIFFFREFGNLIIVLLVLGGIGLFVMFVVVKGDLEKYKRDGKVYE